MPDWVCPNCQFSIGLPEDWGDMPVACPGCDLLEARFENLPEPPPRQQVSVADDASLPESPPSSPIPTAIFLEPHPPPPGGPNRLWHEWLLKPAGGRNPAVGWFLYAWILIVTIVISGVVANLGQDKHGRRQAPGPCQMGFLVLVWGCAAYAFRYARRFRAKPATAVTLIDPRPPVLILRAFADDELPLAGHRGEESWATFGASVDQTFEEYLHNRLSRCGPVIACGRPGQSLPPLGAARFWIRNEDWQLVIGELLRESQYVVMVMGDLVRDEADWERDHEDGLLWEARRVVELAQTEPAKVVLVMPPVDELTAFRRWRHYQRLFGAVLPDSCGDEIAAGFDPGVAARVVRTSRRQLGGSTNRDLTAYDLAIRIRE
jgi:hypothetical protein